MKWKKFQELVKRYPFVASEVSLLGVRLDNKEFMRIHVGFIAFRPFSSLDMNARSSFEVKSLDPEVQFFATQRFEMVEYSVCVGIDGTPERVVLPTSQSPTINEVIDIIDKAFESESMKGKTTSWLHVVKKSAHGSTGNARSFVTDLNIEIYPFPRFYRAKPIHMTPITPASPAHIAYVTGALMPPLIPGTLRFSGDPE